MCGLNEMIKSRKRVVLLNIDSLTPDEAATLAIELVEKVKLKEDVAVIILGRPVMMYKRTKEEFDINNFKLYLQWMGLLNEE